MYMGWAPAVQRAALVQLGDLTTYDFAKQGLMREAGLEDGPVLHALSSACAGLVAATMGAPADVIKTRIMNQPTDGPRMYKNFFDCGVKVVRAQGPLALWAGFVPMWGRTAPTATIQLILFEQIMRVTGGDAL